MPVRALQGWRRNALAFVLGVCATFALPPLFLYYMLVPAFAGLLALVAHAPTTRRAVVDGWWWGLGHFTTSLYWMCIALLTDAEKFGWLIPFTLIGLNGLFALFPALAAGAYHRLGLRREWLKPLAFAAAWTSVEWLRGHVLSGFPWNLQAYAWGDSLSMLQSTRFMGVYGLSFLTVLAAAVPYAAVHPAHQRRGLCVWLLVWVGVLAVAYSGSLRLAAAPAALTEESPGVRLRVVQANISQHHKWDPALQHDGLVKHAKLTRMPGLEAVDVVIWPETAIPYVLNEQPTLRRLLESLIPPQGTLLAGTLRAEGEGASRQAWNSMAVMHAEKITYYDKHHLVPFGEFVPLRRVLPIEKITPGTIDFSRGPGPVTLPLPGKAPPVSPLICYEAIFSGQVVGTPRPGWLLNITNDAWFGMSSGPYQHFTMARVRAIEEGLPLVRAANTGISAVVDAYGRIIAELPLGAEGVIDAPLPPALEAP